MRLRCYASFAALLAFGFAHSLQAQSTISLGSGDISSIQSGNFANDSSYVGFTFSTSSPTDYTFTTTSSASGGFLPVLTLFNDSTGAPVDSSNSGFGDVSLSDTLDSGSYLLDLTEFPSEAVGNLSNGFYPVGAGITGDQCIGLSGENFINTITCSATPLGSNYTVDITSSPVTSTSVTPEPSTFLLMLVPAAGLAEVVRRRRLHA